MPRTSSLIGASILLGFDRFLTDRGVDAALLFKKAGIDPSHAGDPDRDLPMNSVARLMEAAAEAAGDPCLGLNFARAYPVGGTGVIGYLFMNSRTIGDAMKAAARYIPLLKSPETIVFEEEPGGAVLWWRGPEGAKPPYTQLFSFSVGLLVSRLKLVARPGWKPMAVEMQIGPLDCKDTAEDFLGPEIQYYASRNAVHVDAETLARPVPEAEPQLQSVLKRVGDKMIAELPPPGDLADQTRGAIDRLMFERRVALNDVAHYLGLTPRTLQARLAQESTTFEEVLNLARRGRAEQLLGGSELTMTEIALQLGFSELSAFTRAAQRWFGRTPSAQRIHLKSLEPPA